MYHLLGNSNFSNNGRFKTREYKVTSSRETISAGASFPAYEAFGPPSDPIGLNISIDEDLQSFWGCQVWHHIEYVTLL